MTIRDNLGRQKYVFNCSHQGLGDIAEAFDVIEMASVQDTCKRDVRVAGNQNTIHCIFMQCMIYFLKKVKYSYGLLFLPY